MNDRIIFQMMENETVAMDYCFEVGLLPRRKICCGNELQPIFRETTKTKGWYFRCPKNNCRKETSLRKGTFFEKSKLSLGKILALTFYFTQNEVNIESLMRKTGISSCETIVNWLSYCREVCSVWFENHPIVLGGPEVEVEIDEAVLVKRKNNLGRMVREQWVFGIYDVSIKQGFCVAVENRTREVLLPIILERVLPGSNITTDEARVYSNLNEFGYNHKQVKHKIGQFVNYVINATTNHVESYWQRVKLDHKKRCGTHRTTLDSHLDEFMWRERYKKDFNMFVIAIKEIYIVN